ncbi:MAG: AAA family ATPase [Bacteroidota bacterium]|jgi:hypothetical protein
MKDIPYISVSKPTGRSGICYDGNMQNCRDSVQMFVVGKNESFNGFSGTSEFEAFPLRQLFTSRHNKLPSEWDTGYIKTKDIQDYVLKNKRYVIATHYSKNKDIKKCVLYLGGKDCVYVYIYDRGYDSQKDRFGVCLLFIDKTKVVEKMMDDFIKIVIPEKKDNGGYLNILVKNQHGFDLEQKEINCPEIDFAINYNEDFTPIHKLITERLSIDNSKGLVLLHGISGTGKTTYIRYLINILKKRIIYIPPSMASVIADPELIKFFITYSNSIIIIEDAENILMKRVANSTQAIANILNLSDGLLSDCANIQIVATFNTDILNIDEALLRKGRLIAKYEFTQLEESRTLKLSKKLGVKIDGKHTLADIYNSTDNSFTEKNKKVGF